MTKEILESKKEYLLMPSINSVYQHNYDNGVSLNTNEMLEYFVMCTKISY